MVVYEELQPKGSFQWEIWMMSEALLAGDGLWLTLSMGQCKKDVTAVRFNGLVQERYNFSAFQWVSARKM